MKKQQDLESYTNQYINQLPLMNTTNDVHVIPVVVHKHTMISGDFKCSNTISIGLFK